MRERISRLVRGAFGQPSVAAVALLSLAFGIGANSAVFSFVDAVALRPLPVREPGRLMWIYQGDAERPQGSLSYLNWLDVAARAGSFTDVAAFSRRGTVISGDAPARLLLTSVVSPNYFDVVGIEPAVGRLFTADEVGDLASEPVVVLSHGLWQRRYGGDPGIVGTKVRINTVDVTVVGVSRREFRGMEPFVYPDVWLPMATWLQLSPGNRSEFDNRESTWLMAFGRLQPDTTPERAAEQVAALGAALATAYPDVNRGVRMTALTLADARDDSLLFFSTLLMAIAGLVLLVSCANVANLLLVRGETRQQEMAMRAALGASRKRLVAQMLAESLALAAAGAAAALLSAQWLIRLLPAVLPPTSVPLGYDFRLDFRVVGFTLTVTLASVLLFGLVPALRGSRFELMPTLRGDARSGGRRRLLGLRDGLVVGQVAICLVLLTVAGLLLENLWAVANVEMGFVRQEMLLVGLAPSIQGYDRQRSEQLFRDLLDNVSGLPAVRSAAWTRRVPLATSGGGASRQIVVPGYELAPGQDAIDVRFTAVGIGYFRTIGTRLLAGRPFDERDGPEAPRTAMINQTMARTYWDESDVVGRHFLLGGPDGVDCEVVGVVEDGKYISLTEEPRPYLFLPLAQSPSSDMTLLVSTEIAAAEMAGTVEAELHALDPAMPILRMSTLEEHLDFPLYEHRLSAGLLTALGSAALLLAVIGLYGVIGYYVRRRFREIGIRIALGAGGRHVVRFVLGRSGLLVVTGVGAGLVGALLAGRLVASVLYGVSPSDPGVLTVAVLLLATVALAASLLPARRATRIDPLDALRIE